MLNIISNPLFGVLLRKKAISLYPRRWTLVNWVSTVFFFSSAGIHPRQPKDRIGRASPSQQYLPMSGLSNYLYNWQCLKYRVRHLLVRRSWRPNHWTKLDKWGLGWKLDTWRWTWCWFQVDLCSTSSAISIWKLHILQSWIFKDIAIFCHLTKN